MQFIETLKMAFQSLKNNRLRTMLTVLGVVVGIFSIIVIMTVITMLQSTIEEGVSFLSKNTFEIQKYPAIHTGGSFQKYRNRKDITLEDYYRLEGLMSDKVMYMGATQGEGPIVVKYGNKETNPNVWSIGVTYGAYMTYNINIMEGRPFTEMDDQISSDVCVLGYEVYDKIFGSGSAVGKIVRVDNKPMKVIGVLEKQPSFFGQSQDNYIIMPIRTFQSYYGRHEGSISITIQALDKSKYDETIEIATGYMRTIRKVDPWKESDFEIYSNESIMGQINDMTGGIKIGALVVSIIALIAAGVGIMNIMLVSVTERTREIGIRKSIGATRMNILMQFMIEAITLCLFGGFIGIAIGVGIGNLAGAALNASAVIPYDWVMIGMGLCLFIGVLFGTYPAYKAANLDPIEALRYE